MHLQLPHAFFVLFGGPQVEVLPPAVTPGFDGDLDLDFDFDSDP